MAEHDAAAAAREEAARQGVYLLMMALAIPVLVWLERKSAEPDPLLYAQDTWRKAKLRALKGTERFAALTAGEWWKLAERARRAYEAERS